MNEKVALKIAYALALIEGYNEYMYSLSKHDKYAPLYSFTTGNYKGCFNRFNFINKKVLTVCGSGDQIFNAILLGAQKVVAFDINEMSEMLYNLKRAAIKALSHKEYMEFFHYNPYGDRREKNNAFNIKTYWKLTSYLDENAKMFWDNLYLEENGVDIRDSQLFLKDTYDEKEMIISQNEYLDEKRYYELKKKIDDCEVEFIASDIKNLKYKLNDTFDLIFLSNIAQYIPQSENGTDLAFDSRELRKYKKIVMNLASFLRYGGVMAVVYLFDYLCKSDQKFKLICRRHIREKFFPPNLFSYVEFPGVDALLEKVRYNKLGKSKDAVMIYKKEK